jgi:hypothetical protein
VERAKAKWPQISIGVLAVAVGAVIVLLLANGGSESIPGQDGKPAATSQGELQDLARWLGHPIYWLGPRPGATLEVTHDSAADDTYVRYLSAGAPIGSPRPDFVSVGTYLRGSAMRGLRSIAGQPGQRSFTLPGGGLAVTTRGSKSVHLAYPGSDYQLEVYAPNRGEALRIVRDGQVEPLG